LGRRKVLIRVFVSKTTRRSLGTEQGVKDLGGQAFLPGLAADLVQDRLEGRQGGGGEFAQAEA
jgi:hypothetical protein